MKLNRIEQLCRIAREIAVAVGAIAVPVIVAYFGYKIQTQIASDSLRVQAQIASESLKREYVQLAISILKEPRRKGDTGLREWAAALFDLASPVIRDASTIEASFERRGDSVFFDGKPGSPVTATASGTVLKSERAAGGSNVVEIAHGEKFATRYTFSGTRKVKKGDAVASRQEIGALGPKVGDSATAGVLFEILYEGMPQDPMAFLGTRPRGPKSEHPFEPASPRD